MKTNTLLDFNNTEIAFASVPDGELRDKYRLFKLMNNSFLVNTGSKMGLWALKLKLPVKGIIKNTIYKQFCGGEDIEEVKKVIAKLAEYNIKTILDLGVEAKTTEAEFDLSAKNLRKTLEYAIEDSNIHIISSKLTGLMRSSLLQKVTAKESLTEAEQQEFERGKNRIKGICQAAHDAGIFVHIDAEESWIQGAVDDIAMELSMVFNKEKPTVINGIQLYRKDRLDFLQRSLDHARAHNYLAAVKLVRGAYMEKERARAAEMGYPSPIHPTIEDTHQSYNEGLKFCIDHIGEMYLSNATHNEVSCQYLAELMDKKGLPKDHPLVVTAQLYGMGEQISYVMAKAGYNVEKYLPYGPVTDVIPYLIRRTQENSSVSGQMSRELLLIKKELERRGLK